MSRARAALLLAPLTAGLLLGLAGPASAAPSPQSAQGALCHAHPDLCVNEYDRDYRPGWSMVDPSTVRNGGHFTFWDRVRGFEGEMLDTVAALF